MRARGGFGTLLASCRHQAPPGTPPGLPAPGLTPRPVQPLPSVPHQTVPVGPVFPLGHAVPCPSASWGEAPRGSCSRHSGDPHPGRLLCLDVTPRALHGARPVVLRTLWTQRPRGSPRKL